MKELLREPLVHFLSIGAALLALGAWVGAPEDAASRRIEVSAEQIEGLAAAFARTWMRPPSEAELAGLIESHVRDEVYYREARAMGLDEGDEVVRRRLRQKLELILDDLSNAFAPSDQALNAFLQANPERFRVEPRLSFRQVFLNPDKRADLAADAARVLARLRAGDAPEELGDATLLGYEFEGTTPRDVARTFGDAFAQALAGLEPGAWTGPVYSPLGAHLVLVQELQEGRLPELAEVRAAVEREWLARRRQELRDATYRKVLEGYDVVLEGLEGER